MWVILGNYAKPVEITAFESNEFPVECKKAFVIPINWCFGEDANLIPFEFWATDDTSLPDPKPEFVRDLNQALKELGVEKYVSLRRSADIQGQSGWEITPQGKRANIVEFGEMPTGVKKEDMIKVFWNFGNIGKVNQNSIYCYKHKNCVGHVTW